MNAHKKIKFRMCAWGLCYGGVRSGRSRCLANYVCSDAKYVSILFGYATHRSTLSEVENAITELVEVLQIDASK